MTLDNRPKSPSSHNDRVTIPDGWCPRRLAEISDIRPSNVDKKSVSGETPVHLCNYLDVYNNIAITDDLDFMKATATLAEIERFAVESGDVIITKDSETPDDIGVPAVSLATVPDLVCGYHLTLIKPDPSAVEPSFLASQIAHNRISRHFRLHANGSTRFGLTVSTIANTPIWLPPLSEQRRIAEILDAADEAIRQTERVIAKLREVKRGLLHDLLTRGLDADGNLRDPVAHPEQFKDSPLGRIPRTWEVVKTGELFHMQLGKMLSKAARTGQSPFPYLANRNVQWDRVDLSDLEKMDFSEAEREKFSLVEGDLLVCEGGEIGRTAMWQGEMEDCYYQKAIHRLRPKGLAILPGYMLSFMHFAIGKSFFVTLTSQTSIAHLTQEKFALLPVSVPPIEEQKAIVAVLDAHDARIHAEEAVLEKRRQVKRGLMEDLLTGRVRVRS